MSYIPKRILLWPNDASLGESTEYQEADRFYATNQPYLESFIPHDNPTRGAVLIFPGGGMKSLAWVNEGQMIAQWITETLHLCAFIVHYRLTPLHYPQPQQDACQAMRILRRNASSWQLNPDAIGVIGFSIGGHMALQLAVTPDLYRENDGHDDTSLRANWGICGYPVSTMNTELSHQPSTLALFGEPPTAQQQQDCDIASHVDQLSAPLFIFHELGDPAVTSEQSIRLMSALKQQDSHHECHLFNGEKHGVGLAKDASGNVKLWPQMAQQWLIQQHFL